MILTSTILIATTALAVVAQPLSTSGVDYELTRHTSLRSRAGQPVSGDVTDTMEQHVTYSATLKVEGSAGTWDKYNLVVDTGSPMTWFYSEACTAPACKALEKLLSGSDILEEETPFHYETKDGDMLKGNWAVDAIQVDGLAGDASEGRGSRWGIKTPTVFGLVNDGTVQLDADKTGSLGMGVPDNKYDTKPFWEQVGTNVFSLSLGKQGGILRMGGYNPRCMPGGVLDDKRWISVTGTTGWTLKLRSVQAVKPVTTGMTVIPINLPISYRATADLDSGRPAVYAPLKFVQSYYESVHGVVWTEETDGQQILRLGGPPRFKALQWTFNNGAKVSIPTSTFCWKDANGDWYGRYLLPGGNNFQLGQNFLQHVYSIFRIDNDDKKYVNISPLTAGCQ